MATWDDVRAAATPLPGVEEEHWYGEPLFKVGKKGFVHTWKGRVIMKLDRQHQELLFEARPEVFRPYVAGALRWAYVELGQLDTAEVTELVREAWTTVVPKKVSRAYAALSA
jgi:hypothetical protein